MVKKTPLTHFKPLLFPYSHYTGGFLMFSGGRERYEWHEMI